MMYQKIDCPSCGNEVAAKRTRETQKCKWCRRLFKVNIVRIKGRLHWDAEPVDFTTFDDTDAKLLTANQEDD